MGPAFIVLANTKEEKITFKYSPLWKDLPSNQAADGFVCPTNVYSYITKLSKSNKFNNNNWYI